jgi:hypothetical protein
VVNCIAAIEVGTYPIENIDEFLSHVLLPDAKS